MLVLLRWLGKTDITVHGFRSSFRDWSAEQTNFPRDVAEACIAHKLKNEIEATYKRTDLLEKRRLLMNAESALPNTQ